MSEPTLAERFWPKVIKTDGCWVWKGSVRSKIVGRDYGQLHVNGKSRPASKVSWELAHGTPFPAGMDACHSCDNPRCVNPDHIFPGTASDNAYDAVRKGRYWNPSRKTKCLRGHPLSGDNLHIRPSGRRQCQQCKRDWEAINRPWGHRRRPA